MDRRRGVAHALAANFQEGRQSIIEALFLEPEFTAHLRKF
jgi:hypothetical protein